MRGQQLSLGELSSSTDGWCNGFVGLATLQRIFEAVILNCDLSISFATTPFPTGNKSELVLLQWFEDMRSDHRAFRLRHHEAIKCKIDFSFSSERKCMSAIVKVKMMSVYQRGILVMDDSFNSIVSAVTHSEVGQAGLGQHLQPP